MRLFIYTDTPCLAFTVYVASHFACECDETALTWCECSVLRYCAQHVNLHSFIRNCTVMQIEIFTCISYEWMQSLCHMNHVLFIAISFPCAHSVLVSDGLLLVSPVCVHYHSCVVSLECQTADCTTHWTMYAAYTHLWCSHTCSAVQFE